jgi:AcrR family transcriptional regulator
VPKVSEQHLEARRRQILDGARRAFARDGYEGATVVRLERETGLSRGAIFNYFPSKWDIFYALAEEDQHLVAELWLEQGFTAVLRWVTEQKPEWIGVYLEVLRHLRTNEALREQWTKRAPDVNERLREHLLEQQAGGELRADVAADDIGRFLGLIVDGLVLSASVGAEVDLEPLLKLIVAAIGPQS